MTANADLTVFNQRKNADSGDAPWRASVIRGVCWQPGRREFKSADGAAQSSPDGSAWIMIPLGAVADGDREYAEPQLYAAMTTDEAAGAWTLTPGRDRLVRGVADETVVEDIADVAAKYPECVTIVSVERHDYGSQSMRHWEVRGV